VSEIQPQRYLFDFKRTLFSVDRWIIECPLETHIISAGLITPMMVWAFLARRFPQLEASKSQLTLSLAVFSLLFGGFFL